MTRAAVVRRMALDINPWVWVYFVFQIACATLIDWSWLGGTFRSGLFLPPILLYVGTVYSFGKVLLWRTLPVSKLEIDRARWWQGIAAPAMLLLFLGISMALTLAQFGRLTESWSDIAVIVPAQAALCMLLSATVQVALPFLARKMARGGTLLAIPLILIYLRFLIVPSPATLGIIAWALDVAGLAIAAALYFLAGHWPLPILATTAWNLSSAKPSRQSGDHASTLRGWSVLITRSLPPFALFWTATVVIALGLKFALNTPVQFFALVMATVVAQWTMSGLATGLRALRLLPLTAWQLTARLALMMLAVQAVTAACFCAVMTIAGEPVTPGPVAAILVFPLLFFPFLLHFPRMLQMGTAAWIIFVVSMQILGFTPLLLMPTTFAVTAAMVVAPVVLTPLAMAAGILWMQHEITHGRSAYQVKPVAPSRWRGLS